MVSRPQNGHEQLGANGVQLMVARGLRAGYGRGEDIIRDVGLDLGMAEIVAIIGPNGAGKSTLAKVLIGLLPVRSGRLEFEGKDIANWKPHQIVELGVGYVPQVEKVFPTLTVEDNLRMGSYLDPSVVVERGDTMRDWFPIVERFWRKKAGVLSGGERQIVAMARALMMPKPKALILDEPSAGLSPLHVKEVFDRIAELRKRGLSILMIEQNARRALAISDRGYVLDQGQNRYSGPGKDLLDDPKIVELYLGR